jgi:hypothetical protein
LHHRPHFTELATEAFLQRVGGGGSGSSTAISLMSC